VNPNSIRKAAEKIHDLVPGAAVWATGLALCALIVKKNAPPRIATGRFIMFVLNGSGRNGQVIHSIQNQAISYLAISYLAIRY